MIKTVVVAGIPPNSFEHWRTDSIEAAFIGFDPADFEATPGDLLVVDLAQATEVEALRLIRAASVQQIPVLVHAPPDTQSMTIEQAFLAGASDVMVHPFPAALVQAKVRRLLHDHSSVGPGCLLPGGTEAAFGRYSIVGLLGQGSEGAVFRAFDQQSREPVALKVPSLPVDPESRAERRKRFTREAQCLSTLDHPNVVRHRAHGSKHGVDFLATELIEGPTLEEYVQQFGPLDDHELRSLLDGLLAALETVHASGLVHRDLKPQNVVLRDGRVDCPVVVDFGLAKLPLDRSLTVPGDVRGTLGYIAPERLRGLDADAQSDLFSLGLLVCFAANGERPFADLGQVDLITALSTQPVPLFDLEEPLRTLVRQLTSISRARRSPSAADARRALHANTSLGPGS